MLLIPPTGMRAGPIRSGTYNPSRPNHTARRIAAALVSIISTPCAVRSESASCVQERRLDQRPSISGSQVRALVRPPPSPCELGIFPSSSDRPFVPGFALPVSAPPCLCGRALSLAAISTALSPHPRIPFLADKARRLTSRFCRTEARPRRRHQRCFWSVAIVADSTQVLRTAEYIPPEHRAIAQC